MDRAWPDLAIETEVLGAAGLEIVETATDDPTELLEVAAGVDAIMVNWRELPGEVLRAADRCVTVARYGVGVDNIDTSTATELGMIVSRVQDYCVDEVAEHTVALLLALRRRIVQFDAQTRAGGWDTTAFGPMYRMRGTSLGIVGWGAIGRAVAEIARGLGMDVVVWSRSRPTDGWPDHIVAVPTLLDLAGRVDHLSVHVPLSDDTRGLIGAEVLTQLRPTAVVLNTARGPVVDADALADALSAGQLAGAGLDVLASDPPSPDDPLIGLENVIVTPHAAFNSEESLAELRRRAARNVVAVLAGERPSSIANPEVLESAAQMGRRAGEARG